jgi:DNA-binding XRE family transcriptional regulator
MTVKAMRVNANLTQEDVARELNITTLTYRRKEQGKREFKFSELIKLCDLFGVQLEDFVKQ